jgi:3-oxoacyl-[acyl-carrier protein] reductase
MSAAAPWVVVSGAAGALGGLVTAAMAAAGRRVLALDQHAVSAAPGVTAHACDLRDPAAIADGLRGVVGIEPVAVLINCVGRIHSQPTLVLEKGKLRPHGLQPLRDTLDANLVAAFATASVIAAHMARSANGAIINISSVAARGNLGQPAYSAAKAGVEGFTRAMAQELGPLNIRVNALALGFFDVPSTRAALTETALSAYRARTPLGRLGHADDLMSAIQFLETNMFITGAVIDIDGGLRL